VDGIRNLASVLKAEVPDVSHHVGDQQRFGTVWVVGRARLAGQEVRPEVRTIDQQSRHLIVEPGHAEVCVEDGDCVRDLTCRVSWRVCQARRSTDKTTPQTPTTAEMLPRDTSTPCVRGSPCLHEYAACQAALGSPVGRAGVDRGRAGGALLPVHQLAGPPDRRRWSRPAVTNSRSRAMAGSAGRKLGGIGAGSRSLAGSRRSRAWFLRL
jgi:hypothetical protein